MTRPTRDVLLGEISQTRGQRGAVLYAAVAGLDPTGEYGYGEYRYSRAAQGLRSIGAAAKWIGQQTAGSGAS